MLKSLTVITALLTPIVALAIEIQPADFYNDVRSTSPEAAGINMLTREGIVQGYGDRIFGTSRLVNRAEFLKIAMLSTATNLSPLLASNEGCFPDVPTGEWFTPYICAAKNAGVIKGNPDGLFHPERTVQYDEALKMITLLFQYSIPAENYKRDWGEKYYLSAAERGTDLPVRISFATPLTRAYTARLAAAFIAEREGKLTEYRLAEAGQYTDTSSSSSSSSSSVSSQSSSTSSSVASSSSSSVAALYTLPSTSHFLLVGKKSDAIADGVVPSADEERTVTSVQVKLFNEVRSIDKLELTTIDGTVIATLSRRITTDITDYKLTFEAIIQPEQRSLLPANVNVPLVLRAVIRDIANNGFSDELLQVRTFNLTVYGVQSSKTTDISLTGPFPKHQTSFGRIVSVQSTSPTSAPLVAGANITLGSFSFKGVVDPARTLSLSEILFTFQTTGNVSLSTIQLRNPTNNLTVGCSLNAEAKTMFCPFLSQGLGTFAPDLTVDLIADIALPTSATNPTLQVELGSGGTPELLGAVKWTDQSGTFRWVEMTGDPMAYGTLFQ